MTQDRRKDYRQRSGGERCRRRFPLDAEHLDALAQAYGSCLIRQSASTLAQAQRLLKS